MAKRKAYRVQLRRIYTGCDYFKTLFLASPADALDRASRYVPRVERNGLRLVACTELTDDETEAFRQGVANLTNGKWE